MTTGTGIASVGVRIDCSGQYKASTTWCAEIFDELNTVINFIEVGKSYLNATQQELLERFSLSAVEFAHDFLLAEGNKEEIERRLAVSGHNVRILFSDAIISGPRQLS